NHDQIANSGLGQRVDRTSSPGRLRAMTALWLLSPQTPMFFQGQEFAASAPFLYFADPGPSAAATVKAGRMEFLNQFPSLATDEARTALADPCDRHSFERCKLDFPERPRHAPSYALHRDLLRLRREDAVFRRQQADCLEGVALARDALCLRYFGEDDDDRLVLVNFGHDL